MAAPTNAHGSSIQVPDGTTFNVTVSRIQKRARLAESTDSGTSGRERWTKIITGALLTIDFVWDSDLIPDTDVSLDAGDTVQFRQVIGSTGKFYSIAQIIVETLETVYDNVNDVVRGTVVALANGAITDPVT